MISRSAHDHKSRAIFVFGLRISLWLIPLALMAPANAPSTQQSARQRWATQRDDHEVSWAAIAPPRTCHSMAWSGVRRYLIIYIVNLLLLTNKCQQRSSTDYALSVAHNTSRILATIANFSRWLRLPFGRISACAWEKSLMSSSFHVCSVWSELVLNKIELPVPTCNSTFYSGLLCHEHYLSDMAQFWIPLILF